MNASEKAQQKAGVTLSALNVLGPYAVTPDLSTRLQSACTFLGQVGCKYTGFETRFYPEVTDVLRDGNFVMVADDPMEVVIVPRIERKQEYHEGLGSHDYDELSEINFVLFGLEGKRKRRVEGAIRKAFGD